MEKWRKVHKLSIIVKNHFIICFHEVFNSMEDVHDIIIRGQGAGYRTM